MEANSGSGEGTDPHRKRDASHIGSSEVEQCRDKLNKLDQYLTLSPEKDLDRDDDSELNNYMSMLGNVLENPMKISVMQILSQRNSDELEFMDFARAMMWSLEGVFSTNSKYINLFESIIEPDRVTTFRVQWRDDTGATRVNRGFHILFDQTLGPCRGCLYFHPRMNIDMAKCLGLEETIKNALSPYKLGGSSGGSDFNPIGKSRKEIRNFCHSFMTELHGDLGPNKDLPLEGMLVGTQEMGFLLGQYRRLADHSQGSFAGTWFGSTLRTKAFGYGLVIFTQLMLADMNEELKGQRCAVWGSGEVAMHVLEKLHACNALPITVSDSEGYLVDNDGFNEEKISLLRKIKAENGSLRDYPKTFAQSKFHGQDSPWNEKFDVAFVCPTKTIAIFESDANMVVNWGCRVLVEGTFVAFNAGALDILKKGKVRIAPSVAAGVGGVIGGELELEDCNLSAEEFENKLQKAMEESYERVCKAETKFGYSKDDHLHALARAATISAFLRIAESMSEKRLE